MTKIHSESYSCHCSVEQSKANPRRASCIPSNFQVSSCSLILMSSKTTAMEGEVQLCIFDFKTSVLSLFQCWSKAVVCVRVLPSLLHCKKQTLKNKFHSSNFMITLTCTEKGEAKSNYITLNYATFQFPFSQFKSLCTT